MFRSHAVYEESFRFYRDHGMVREGATNRAIMDAGLIVIMEFVVTLLIAAAVAETGAVTGGVVGTTGGMITSILILSVRAVPAQHVDNMLHKGIDKVLEIRRHIEEL